MTTFNFRCENQDSVYIIVTRIQSGHSKSFFYHQRRTLRCLIGSWWLYLAPDCQKSVMQKHDKFRFSEWESKFGANNKHQDPIRPPRVLLLSLKKDFAWSDWILAIVVVVVDHGFGHGQRRQKNWTQNQFDGGESVPPDGSQDWAASKWSYKIY